MSTMNTPEGAATTKDAYGDYSFLLDIDVDDTTNMSTNATTSTQDRTAMKDEFGDYSFLLDADMIDASCMAMAPPSKQHDNKDSERDTVLCKADTPTKKKMVVNPYNKTPPRRKLPRRNDVVGRGGVLANATNSLTPTRTTASSSPNPKSSVNRIRNKVPSPIHQKWTTNPYKKKPALKNRIASTSSSIMAVVTPSPNNNKVGMRRIMVSTSPPQGAVVSTPVLRKDNRAASPSTRAVVVNPYRKKTTDKVQQPPKVVARTSAGSPANVYKKESTPVVTPRVACPPNDDANKRGGATSR